MDKNKKLNAEEIDKVTGGFILPIELGNGALACGKCGETLSYDGGTRPYEAYRCKNTNCSEYNIQVTILKI